VFELLVDDSAIVNYYSMHHKDYWNVV
jgi:hypothetical protein